MVNEYHIYACGWATKEEVETIKDITFRVNEYLKNYFAAIGILLVDFKLEFGKTADGKIVLADEISPDTCRFFRRDLGNVEDAYQEICRRLLGE